MKTLRDSAPKAGVRVPRIPPRFGTPSVLGAKSDKGRVGTPFHVTAGQEVYPGRDALGRVGTHKEKGAGTHWDAVFWSLQRESDCGPSPLVLIGGQRDPR